MKVVVTGKTGDEGGPRGCKGQEVPFLSPCPSFSSLLILILCICKIICWVFCTSLLNLQMAEVSTTRFTVVSIDYNSQHSVGMFECIEEEIKIHQEQWLPSMIGHIGTRLKMFSLILGK